MKITPGSPFHPTFGSTPPELAGRHAVIDAIAGALGSGPGAAARTSLITGSRGIGKTVTLNAIEDAASERGWIVLSESVSPGLMSRLRDERIPSSYRLLAGPRGRRLTGITLPAGMGGISLTPPSPDVPLGFRDSLSRLIEMIEDHGGSGVMITLDEVHGSRGRDDLVELAVQVQHLVRQDANIALVAAGLPNAVQDLLNDDVTTFLRRAERFPLGTLHRLDAADALQVPIEEGGRSIADEALQRAVSATFGYPYLIQVIGDYAWKRAPEGNRIELKHVEWAARRAIADMGARVHEPALHDLSAKDREFLQAMAADDGPALISDVAARMGRTLSYTSRYRQRLLSAELILTAGRGRLDFALPYLRDHLRLGDYAAGTRESEY